MILQNRVIDVLKNQEVEPYYPPDPSGNPVTAIPCDDTVTLGMIYDSETGIQTTMPINVNGVWNASVGSMFSTPFRNKKFSISNDLGFSYSNNIGYVNQGKGESLRNRTGDFSINERPRFAYRSDWFDFELGGNYSYRLTRNSLQGQQDRNQMNYGGSANVSVYLPWSIILGSDFNYTGREGYGTGIQKNVYMWNAEVSYQFLKGKSATLLFKIYDILKQRNSISRTVTGNYMQDTQSNVLTSYCMLSFTYRFNTFGKKGGSGPDGGPGRGREGDFRPQRGGDFRGRPGVPMRVF